MAKAISDLHLDLAYRLGESSAPTDSGELARRLNWFKTAINKVCAGEELFWFMAKKGSGATEAEKQRYSVPSDFRKFIQIKVDDYRYTENDLEDIYPIYELPQSPVPILPSFLARGFYKIGTYYYLIPIPTAASTAKTLTSLTSSGTTCTGTTAAAHSIEIGQFFVIAGATPSTYNGTFEITSVPTSTTFTYEVTAAPASSPATGTITATRNNIDIWYYSLPTEPTATTSGITVPDEFIDMLAAYAEGRYWSYAHKRGKSADAFTEFETRLMDLKKENFRRKFLAP